LGSSGVVLTLDVWCADALSAISFKCDLLEQATRRFAVEGIGIPLPQMMVVLKNDRHINGEKEKEGTG
jgi:small-conductance mechanosensitive channel